MTIISSTGTSMSSCLSVIPGGQRENTTYRVFTNLSRLATCDYSLMFNRPIKVFMERGAFAAGGLAQRSADLCVTRFGT